MFSFYKDYVMPLQILKQVKTRTVYTSYDIDIKYQSKVNIGEKKRKENKTKKNTKQLY